MQHSTTHKPYTRFFIALLISFVIMYAIIFLNVNAADDIFLSLTRTYMSLLMVSSMMIVMLLMMGSMYKNKTKNIIILFSGAILFLTSLYFLRAQVFVSDHEYMKAMIPHHSSAILTSENADIKNPKVKELSNQIIEAQKKEISLMKDLLNNE